MSESAIQSLEAITRTQRAFSDGLSGIPTVQPDLGKVITGYDAEQVSGSLAAELTLPESVDFNDAANTLLAVLREKWSASSPEAQALFINFAQRSLSELGLKVVRKDG